MIYSSDIQDTKTEPKFPKFIRNSYVFTKNKIYTKVFPDIGLSNFDVRIGDIKHTYSMIGATCEFVEKLVERDNDYLAHKFAPPTFLWGKLFTNWVYLKRYVMHNANHRMVFSSVGRQGAWDILTMSERGIKSCQSWDGQRHEELINSVADPCFGVIYLTNGTESASKRGTTMLYRCVVRYVIVDDIGPALMLEKPYGADALIDGLSISMLFAAMLTQQTDLPVFYEAWGGATRDFSRCASIPSPTHTFYSYRDSQIPYARFTDSTWTDLPYSSMGELKCHFLEPKNEVIINNKADKN